MFNFSLFNFIKKRFIKPTESLSPYQEAIQAFQRQKIPDHRVFSDIEKISVLYSNIILYTTVVEAACVLLAEDRPIRTVSGIETTQLIPRKSFYISLDRFFIKPEKATPLFITAACQLLILYERKHHELEPSGVVQYNLTRILPLVNNLIALSTTLAKEDLI